MSKPAIYWAVVRNSWSNLHGFKVLKITSVNNRLAFGSDEHNNTTRLRLDDIKAKLETKELANQALAGIKLIYDTCEPDLQRARKRIIELEIERKVAVDALLKGMTL